MPVRKTKKGYKIDNTKGYSKSRSEATKRLKAIKASKKRKKKK